jgi:hypothetical protein
VSSAERKGKAGPLEAGRGKYSPPANPERVTLEALKRRDNGFLRQRLCLSGEERLFRRSRVISGPAVALTPSPPLLPSKDEVYARIERGA